MTVVVTIVGVAVVGAVVGFVVDGAVVGCDVIRSVIGWIEVGAFFIVDGWVVAVAPGML